MKKYLITFSGTYEIWQLGNLSALTRKLNNVFDEQALGIEVVVYDITGYLSGKNLLNELYNYEVVKTFCRG